MAESKSLVELRREFVEIGKSMELTGGELQAFVREELEREEKMREWEVKRAEVENK